MHNGFTPQTNLQGQEECEEELVADIQTSYSVLEHLIGEVFYDVVEPLGREGGAVRPAS